MARRDFLDRIEALLRVNIPPAAASHHDLRRMAEHCVETAEQAGLITERAIAAFVLHMVRINPEFYRQPIMAVILADTSVDENSRMEHLLSGPTEADWEEAAGMCDPKIYWQPFRVPGPAPGP